MLVVHGVGISHVLDVQEICIRGLGLDSKIILYLNTL